MGSATSKATKAAGSAARKYPARPNAASQTAPATQAYVPQTPGPQVHPDQFASTSKDQSVRNDASDPVLDSHLRRLGPVESNPYQSHTATTTESTHTNAPKSKGLPAQFAPPVVEAPPGLFPSASAMRNNPALMVLQARNRLAEQADKEVDGTGRRGFEGRTFLDVWIIMDALRLRARGVTDTDIEQRLGIKRGTLSRLGEPGVLEAGHK